MDSSIFKVLEFLYLEKEEKKMEHVICVVVVVLELGDGLLLWTNNEMLKEFTECVGPHMCDLNSAFDDDNHNPGIYILTADVEAISESLDADDDYTVQWYNEVVRPATANDLITLMGLQP